MADGVSYTMVTKPFTDFLDDRQAKMRRAAMFTVREGGRVAKAAARGAAPVLRDRSAVRVTAWKRGGRAWSNAPVAGLLRSSITPSRRLQTYGDTWSLKVGPRGARVHLYAKKEEARAHFMAAGFAAVEAAMPAIAQRAYDRVWVE